MQLAKSSLLVSLACACAGSLVAQCDPDTVGSGGSIGPDGRVFASVLWDPDQAGPLPEHLVVAGDFLSIGSTVARGLAIRDPATGAWSELAECAGGRATSLDVGPGGDLLVGTDPGVTIDGVSGSTVFTFDGSTWSAVGALSVPAGNLLAWNNQIVVPDFGLVWFWDGASWGSWSWGGVTALALAEAPNGDLIVVGHGSSSSRIRIWNGTTWSSVPGPNSTVLAVAVHGSDVFFGGSFTAPYANLTRWDGATFHPVGAVASAVFHVDVGPSGDVYVVRSQPSGSAVSVFDGSTWQDVGSIDGSVAAFQFSASSGDTFLTGSFREVDTLAIRCVAKWSGSAWEAAANGLSNGEILEIVRVANGDLLLGGAFTSLDGVSARRIVRYDGTGFHALGSGLPTSVSAITEAPGGDIYVVHGIGTTFQASAWDGTSWTPLGTDYDNSVPSILAASNGSVYSLRGDSCYVWTGSTWQLETPFVSYCIAEIGGDLYLGGTGVYRKSGASWVEVIPATVGDVYDITGMPDGRVALAGQLNVGGPTGVAIYDGTSLTAPGGGIGQAFEVDALPNGDLLAILGNPSSGSGATLARFDGSAWSNLGEGVSISLNSNITGTEVLENGRIVVHGGFGLFDDVASAYMAFLDPTCPAGADDLAGGCPSSGGGNVLAAETLPWVGATLVTNATELPTSALVAVVIGFGQQPIALTAVTPFAVPGCTLVPTADLTDYLVGDNGTAHYELPIPNIPALAGLAFFQQMLPIEVNQSLGILGITATNVLAFTLGAL